MASREEKAKRFNEVLDEIGAITIAMEAEDGKGDTPDNHEKLQALLNEGDTLRKSIEQDNKINGFKSFLEDPATGSKAFGPGDGIISEPFKGRKSIGEQFIEQAEYQASIKSGGRLPQGFNLGFDAKGFLPSAVKDTFNLSGTGLDSSRNYIARDVELVQQQQPTVRDLLSVGETSQNIVYFIKESSYTQGADMTAEEGEKPEATLVTTTSSASVKKIAVVLKVTEEMWQDFPMLRDYVNGRLMFMVQSKEDDQLLNGSGSGNNLTGLLNTSGIQTQACGSISATNPVVDSIHKAMVKIRTPTTGGYIPDGIIMNPTDYQIIRLTKDGQNQYFGGGPFYGAYGNGGPAAAEPGPWGLKLVQTTAIAAGTALVGAFKYGAQLWQREGIRVDATNTNEDDFNFNRISLRVEERLALTVYAPGAFCTVTSIA